MNFIKIIQGRKIIGGKLYHRYFIDSEGIEVGIPTGIHLMKLSNHHYVAASPNKKKYPDSTSIYQSYHDGLSQEEAIKRCIIILKTLTKNTSSTIRELHSFSVKTPADNRFPIDIDELPIGISLRTQINKKQIHLLSLGVSCFILDEKRFRTKSIYVGTANTWKERYPQKLQEAIKLREESLKIYNKLTSQNQNAETIAA